MSLLDNKNLPREQRVLGNVKVPVAVVPRPRRSHIVPNVGFSFASLLKGMALTLRYLLRPSTVVTRQYPENRPTLKFPERYRARLHLIYDENGYHLCTACKLCEKACPNASIRVVTRKGQVTGKNEVDHYVWRLDSCMFCNACVQACPFKALEMGHEFENAVYDRRLFLMNLNRYAGPAASVLLKQEDAELRKQMMEPRGVYDGPVPLNGHAMPGLRPVGKAEAGDSAGGQS